jgi:hypothetical protein
MKDGHFKLDANLVNGATHYAGSGDGQLVLKPRLAMKMNVQVDTGTILGRIGADLIVYGGKEYTRIGSGAWSITQDTASGGMSPSKASYIGESEIAGNKAWHIRSHDSTSTFDEWVRESDGYMVKYSVAQDAGTTLQMTFDEFNTGQTVTPPSQVEIAASQYQALVGPFNSQLDSLNRSYGLDFSLRNLSGFKNDTSQLAQLEQTYIDGLSKIDWPGSMDADVASLKAVEQTYTQKLQQRSQFTSWDQVDSDEAPFQAVVNSETAAINRVRADLGLPASS